MAWFAELAGKAENLLNNLDEQTGVALRNHSVSKPKKYDHNEFPNYPEATWNRKKRPIPRALKKIPITDSKSNYVPSRKSSPTSHHSSPTRDPQESVKTKKSPVKKQYNLNNCPKTLVGDVRETEIIMDRRSRRGSLPSDLRNNAYEELKFIMENLEVENAMLKNELNVMNKEVTELIDMLRKTEDGEGVVVGSSKELCETKTKLLNTENLNHIVNLEKNSLSSQLEQLKNQIKNITTIDIDRFKDQKLHLENEISRIREKNAELENNLRKLKEKANESDSIQIKLENDLRHAQSNIMSLQSDLEKSNGECRRLEKDWDTYKHRVKGMLSAKDKEVKALQDGMNLTEDTKILVEQIENLREEREVLSEAVTRVRGECSDLKHYMETLETRHAAAERVVLALRDALKDERAAKNRAETQYFAIAKELKLVQIESGQTIASLRTALRDKDNELNNLKDSTSSSLRTTDTSALNVGDYDISHDSIDNEKLCYLTQRLVQSQGKTDKLLAENNTLKIQLEKMESRYKAELLSSTKKNTHSVVHFQDNDQHIKSRSHHQQSISPLNNVSRRIDALIRRKPLFRIMALLYMIGLHFWVLTVLFTSTPENYNTQDKDQEPLKL